MWLYKYDLQNVSKHLWFDASLILLSDTVNGKCTFVVSTFTHSHTLVIIVHMAKPFVNRAVFLKWLKLFNYFNTFNPNLLGKWLLTSENINPPFLINVCFQYLILVFYISVVNIRECSPAEPVSKHKDSGRCIRATGLFEILGDVSPKRLNQFWGNMSVKVLSHPGHGKSSNSRYDSTARIIMNWMNGNLHRHKVGCDFSLDNFSNSQNNCMLSDVVAHCCWLNLLKGLFRSLWASWLLQVHL